MTTSKTDSETRTTPSSGQTGVTHHTDTWTNGDGLTLFVQSWWPETNDVRALVILVHGFAEHSARYDHVARFLAERGYSVCALDQRGHGRSEGPRANVHVFDDLAADLWHYSETLYERRPTLPRFLLGHSMGGAVALQVGLEHPDKFSGLILSGPYLQNPVPLPPLLEPALAWLSRAFPNAPTTALDVEAISRDPAEVAAYRNDPLTYDGRIKMRIGLELLRAGPRLLSLAHKVVLPTLILHGDADRLADVRGSEQLFKRMQSADKTLKVYEGGYHELFNDTERERVLGDLLAWLEART